MKKSFPSKFQKYQKGNQLGWIKNQKEEKLKDFPQGVNIGLVLSYENSYKTIDELMNIVFRWKKDSALSYFITKIMPPPTNRGYNNSGDNQFSKMIIRAQQILESSPTLLVVCDDIAGVVLRSLLKEEDRRNFNYFFHKKKTHVVFADLAMEIKNREVYFPSYLQFLQDPRFPLNTIIESKRKILQPTLSLCPSTLVSPSVEPSIPEPAAPSVEQSTPVSPSVEPSTLVSPSVEQSTPVEPPAQSAESSTPVSPSVEPSTLVSPSVEPSIPEPAAQCAESSTLVSPTRPIELPPAPSVEKSTPVEPPAPSVEQSTPVEPPAQSVEQSTHGVSPSRPIELPPAPSVEQSTPVEPPAQSAKSSASKVEPIELVVPMNLLSLNNSKKTPVETSSQGVGSTSSEQNLKQRSSSNYIKTYGKINCPEKFNLDFNLEYQSNPHYLCFLASTFGIKSRSYKGSRICEICFKESNNGSCGHEIPEEDEWEIRASKCGVIKYRDFSKFKQINMEWLKNPPNSNPTKTKAPSRPKPNVWVCDRQLKGLETIPQGFEVGVILSDPVNKRHLALNPTGTRICQTFRFLENFLNTLTSELGEYKCFITDIYPYVGNSCLGLSHECWDEMVAQARLVMETPPKVLILSGGTAFKTFISVFKDTKPITGSKDIYKRGDLLIIHLKHFSQTVPQELEPFKNLITGFLKSGTVKLDYFKNVDIGINSNLNNIKGKNDTNSATGTYIANFYKKFQDDIQTSYKNVIGSSKGTYFKPYLQNQPLNPHQYPHSPTQQHHKAQYQNGKVPFNIGPFNSISESTPIPTPLYESTGSTSNFTSLDKSQNNNNNYNNNNNNNNNAQYSVVIHEGKMTLLIKKVIISNTGLNHIIGENEAAMCNFQESQTCPKRETPSKKPLCQNCQGTMTGENSPIKGKKPLQYSFSNNGKVNKNFVSPLTPKKNKQ